MKSFTHYDKMPEEWKQGSVSDEIYFDENCINEIWDYLVNIEFGGVARAYVAVIRNTPYTPYVFFEVKGRRHTDYIASFCLSTLFQTPQVLWSSQTQIQMKYRKLGYSYKLMRMKEYIAKVYGCEALMASVNNENLIQCHILVNTDGTR